MAELKTKKTKASVETFLRSVTEDRVADCRTLVRLMKEATGDEAALWGPSIIGFGSRRLRYPSGRELDWFQIGFSPRKSDFTLYLMSGLSTHEVLLRKLGTYRVGKGCLYVKRLADVDLAVLKKLLRESVAQPAGV